MSDADDNVMSMHEGRKRLRPAWNWCATEWRLKDREPLIDRQRRKMEKRIEREKGS